MYGNERKPSTNLLGRRGCGRLCPLPERSQNSGDGTAAITVHSVVRRWWRVPSSRAVPSKNPGGRRWRSEWECAHAHSQAVEEIVALGTWGARARRSSVLPATGILYIDTDSSARARGAVYFRTADGWIGRTGWAVGCPTGWAIGATNGPVRRPWYDNNIITIYNNRRQVRAFNVCTINSERYYINSKYLCGWPCVR